MIDADELLKELGFSESCNNCPRALKRCDYYVIYTMKDICEMVSDAIEAIEDRQRGVIRGKRLTDIESWSMAVQDPPDVPKELFWAKNNIQEKNGNV